MEEAQRAHEARVRSLPYEQNHREGVINWAWRWIGRGMRAADFVAGITVDGVARGTAQRLAEERRRAGTSHVLAPAELARRLADAERVGTDLDRVAASLRSRRDHAVEQIAVWTGKVTLVSDAGDADLAEKATILLGKWTEIRDQADAQLADFGPTCQLVAAAIDGLRELVARAPDPLGTPAASSAACSDAVGDGSADSTMK
jgi:hypothetical protein